MASCETMTIEDFDTAPGRLHGPAKCPRRCSECAGNHHWIEHCPDPEFDKDRISMAMLAVGVEAGYVCKHCDAWAEMGDEEGL